MYKWEVEDESSNDKDEGVEIFYSWFINDWSNNQVTGNKEYKDWRNDWNLKIKNKNTQ